MNSISSIKESLISEILSLVVAAPGRKVDFFGTAIKAVDPATGLDIAVCGVFYGEGGVLALVSSADEESVDCDPVPLNEFWAEEVEAVLRKVRVSLNVKEPHCEWVAVSDEDVSTVWVDEDADTDDGSAELVECAPSFFQDNGTPGSDNGGDCRYLFTKVRMPATDITVIEMRRDDLGLCDDESPTFCIGAVRGLYTPEDISALHGEWREAVPSPDSDCEFVSWLVSSKGFSEAPIPNIVTI